MSAASSLVSVTELLKRPGVSRPLDLEFDVPEGLDLPLVGEVAPLRLEGVLESVVDGILVRGRLRTTLGMLCARCLAPVPHRLEAPVTELYVDPVMADDPADVEAGYEIREGTLDLDTLLRDTLLPATPVAPRCRPDCRGLCPTCGADRNVVDCACVEQTTDTRWAALEGLRLDERSAN